MRKGFVRTIERKPTFDGKGRSENAVTPLKLGPSSVDQRFPIEAFTTEDSLIYTVVQRSQALTS